MTKLEATQEEFDLSFRLREGTTLSIEVPKDTLGSLKQVAGERDMSVHALLKFYIGQGLRHDVTRFFGDRVLETTGEVLARHIESEDEVNSILQEIRAEAIR